METLRTVVMFLIFVEFFSIISKILGHIEALVSFRLNIRFDCFK